MCPHSAQILILHGGREGAKSSESPSNCEYHFWGHCWEHYALLIAAFGGFWKRLHFPNWVEGLVIRFPEAPPNDRRYTMFKNRKQCQNTENVPSYKEHISTVHCKDQELFPQSSDPSTSCTQRDLLQPADRCQGLPIGHGWKGRLGCQAGAVNEAVKRPRPLQKSRAHAVSLYTGQPLGFGDRYLALLQRCWALEARPRRKYCRSLQLRKEWREPHLLQLFFNFFILISETRRWPKSGQTKWLYKMAVSTPHNSTYI